MIYRLKKSLDCNGNERKKFHNKSKIFNENNFTSRILFVSISIFDRIIPKSL